MVCGDSLDGVLFPFDGGCSPDLPDLSLDVPHLRTGGAVSAFVSGIPAVLPPLAAGRLLCICHFCCGIHDGLAAADMDGGLSVGLWGQAVFRHGLHSSGLRTPLGDIGIVF